MAKLSTHVLDVENGVPAQGVKIEFFRLEGNILSLIKTLVTNSDGRTDELLLDEASMQVGEYQLLFHIGDYFAAHSKLGKQSDFLNRIPIQFSITDAAENYHVPLLASQWSYSTYRGS